VGAKDIPISQKKIINGTATRIKLTYFLRKFRRPLALLIEERKLQSIPLKRMEAKRRIVGGDRRFVRRHYGNADSVPPASSSDGAVASACVTYTGRLIARIYCSRRPLQLQLKWPCQQWSINLGVSLDAA